MCGCEHHHDLNAPCTCECPSHEAVRREMALTRPVHDGARGDKRKSRDHQAHPDGTVAELIEQARADGAAAALREAVTEEEADALDRAMNEHMYRHTISNSYAGMSCNSGCRTDALRRFVERLLRDRADRLAPTTEGGTR